MKLVISMISMKLVKFDYDFNTEIDMEADRAGSRAGPDRAGPSKAGLNFLGPRTERVKNRPKMGPKAIKRK